MTSIPSDVRNYFKLELLQARSYVLLRQLFKNRYSQFNAGQLWDDTPTCGNNYLTKVVAKNKQISLTKVQKTSVSNGNSNDWDSTTLAALLLYGERPKTLSALEIQQLDHEDTLLKQLKEIRNELAHHATKSILDAEFNRLWTDLAVILVAFGDIDTELDKLKDDSVFDSQTQPANETNVKEASRLNSLGTQAHKDGKFSEAIILFTKATVLSGVPDHDRAIFFSNMASSRVGLYEQQPSHSTMLDIDNLIDERYRALQDAKQARTLWPTWWKGHLRVGKVYAALNDHEKAINSFERALALAPTNSDVQKALDDSRQVHGRQSRREHLDPRTKPTTMPEHLNELQHKLGIDPEEVRMSHRLLEEIDPVGADVVKGHKYEHGDIDVKQDYEQAAKCFAKAASQGNAEGMYNLARLTGRGLGVKKDHQMALKLLKQAATQSPQHSVFKSRPNIGVAEAEHVLGLRYAEGVAVHKNLRTAAYWYQRAVDHGSAQSANNLGLMYLEGVGVNKDLQKAEELLELSARRGDPNAMQTLALLLLDKNDFQMAKIWYDRACEADNIVARTNGNMFEKALQEKKQFIDTCPSNALQMINAIKNVENSLNTRKTPSKGTDPQIYNYSLLTEHANRGSITAKHMCDALDHFNHAMSILFQTETFTEDQENAFVRELSQCYRIEHIVAVIPGVIMRKRTDEIVDRVLARCSANLDNTVSQLDEDARTCYAVLHMDSLKLIRRFLSLCKEKYPKSIFFFQLSAATNGWLNQCEDTLYDANSGLELDPNYYHLLYDRAVALRQIGEDMDEAIKAYRTFLVMAPRDHRKVPESYYAIANCYIMRDQQKVMEDTIRKIYREGEEAEKIQLPCFLPYKSNSKILVQHILNAKSLLVSDSPPSIDRKLRLKNSHRLELILKHREWQAKTSQQINNSDYSVMTNTRKPRVKQQTTKSLIGLKSITLKEINPTKDHVYNGYVLSVTIIEEAYSWTPSIHLVIEDENLDCEQMCIYGFPEEQGQYLTSKVYTIGSKMNIINPYLRIGPNDRKPLIRIDDVSSILMQNESERVINMCRCCGESNAPHVCNRCREARYCSKECQTMDWQLYKHKLICKNQ